MAQITQISGHHRWRDMGSPEGEKLQENLIQNYTRKKGSLVKTSVLLTDCFHNLKNKDYHDDNDFILEH